MFHLMVLYKWVLYLSLNITYKKIASTTLSKVEAVFYI